MSGKSTDPETETDAEHEETTGILTRFKRLFRRS